MISCTTRTFEISCPPHHSDVNEVLVTIEKMAVIFGTTTKIIIIAIVDTTCDLEIPQGHARFMKQHCVIAFVI